MIDYKIAVNTPFNDSVLSYVSTLELKSGTYVQVPLGKRQVSGWVIGIGSEHDKELKAITNRGDSVLDITQHELALFSWMSSYYHYPLGMLISDTMPKEMKRPRKDDESFTKTQAAQQEIHLTSSQREIFDSVNRSLTKGFSRHLIHGVTGSGKTHIYLNLIQEVLKSGKSVLFLLPEINLTPQFLDKFKSLLDCPVDVYSSEVSPSKRYLLRQELKDQKKARVVISVRSGVFLPIENLGLIIVDEEHDSSFKQDDRCTYNARDVAIKRAAMLEVPIVLGSATPSMESYYSAKEKGGYYPLRHRVNDIKMPDIELIDQRQGSSEFDEDCWPLTAKTMQAIYEAKERGEQALVFINRLGFSSYVQCSSCGHQFHCPNCSTNLRFFKQRNELSCQTCGIKAPMPNICPECSCLTLTQKGYGTEKIEEVLKGKITNLRVERFDRDEIRTLDQLKKSLDRFHNHEVDVLVGTQMLSKGHNFKRVNTVIILGIDQQLNFPDFRALERAWQTLVQVSGRSGRFGADSKVLIQTYTPEHPLFIHVTNNHFDEFYLEESDLRTRANCPPFIKMAGIYLTHKDKGALIKVAQELGHWLLGLVEHHYDKVDVLGPRPAIMEKRVNKFTWCLMLRSNDINSLHSVINQIQNRLVNSRGLQVKIDVDPQVIL